MTIITHQQIHLKSPIIIAISKIKHNLMLWDMKEHWTTWRAVSRVPMRRFSIIKMLILP